MRLSLPPVIISSFFWKKKKCVGSIHGPCGYLHNVWLVAFPFWCLPGPVWKNGKSMSLTAPPVHTAHAMCAPYTPTVPPPTTPPPHSPHPRRCLCEWTDRWIPSPPPTPLAPPPRLCSMHVHTDMHFPCLEGRREIDRAAMLYACAHRYAFSILTSRAPF